MRKVTLRMFYEILYDAENLMNDTPQVLFLKSYEWFKRFVRQISRFARDEHFYLNAGMLELSRTFLSIYSYSRVSARQLAKAKDIEIFIDELLEGLKAKEGI